MEGHHHGPSSPQRKDALKAVDTVFKYMAQWIQVTREQGPPGCPPSCHSLSVSLTVTPLSIVSPDVEADVPAPGHDGSISLTHPSSARGREMTQTSIDGHQLARRPGSAPKSMSGAWPGSQAGLCPSCATAWLNDWARRYVSKLGWALVCTSVEWGGTVLSPCKWLKERKVTTVRALCWVKGPSVLSFASLEWGSGATRSPECFCPVSTVSSGGRLDD